MPTATDIQERLRKSIRSYEYGTIEELSQDSGIGISTIQKFLNGGDILFSDAAQLIAVSRGNIIMPQDWLDMKQNLLEEIDNEDSI